jgi:predicted component of type VI protein secretion system
MGFHFENICKSPEGTSMQVVLVMFRAGGERRSFSIVRDVTVIGRREDCDFRIPLGDISRKHCRLIKEENSLKIEDLGSSNGTYVNGKRIHEAELQAGETVQIGPVVFVVQLDGTPADDELRPWEPEPAAAENGEEEPMVEFEDSEESGATSAPNNKADEILIDDGNFDPMSVLEGNVDSDIMPAIGESAINEDVMVDMSENDEKNG